MTNATILAMIAAREEPNDPDEYDGPDTEPERD